MHTKKIFLIVAVGSVLLAILLGATGIITGTFSSRPELATAYGFLLDVVFGSLTVWGLYWAASEFAEQSIRPKLSLMLGTVAEEPREGASVPIENPLTSLPGYMGIDGDEATGRVKVGLFLENHRPKMAQNVQVALEIKCEPAIDEVSPLAESSPYKYDGTLVESNSVIMQFEGNLIVYKGQRAYIGILDLWWRKGAFPRTCELHYTIYKSEGESDSGQHSISINWTPA
jgi:hypothetical protein